VLEQLVLEREQVLREVLEEEEQPLLEQQQRRHSL
jgi:hypothetical protein